MDKGIIIIGKALSGKTRLANGLVKNQDAKKVCFIDGKLFKKESFPFRNCTKETKFIIIDDLINIDVIKGFYNTIPQGHLLVDSPNQAIFSIYIDQLILVFDESITIGNLPKDASFLRRFKIIDLNATIQ